MTDARVNLLGLPPAALRAFFLELGEQPFRAQQVLKWIHQAGVDTFADMSNLSKPLRQKLAAVAEIRAPELCEQQDAADGTRKWSLRVQGGGLVETVFIPAAERGTLCVSSQLGCSLDCSFCATGKQGFERDLSAAEIIGQLWLALRSFAAFRSDTNSGRPRAGRPDKPRKVTNVVLMGMGEPLLNFDNVVAATELMLDDLAYGLSRRRVTLSTAGVVPALDKLAAVSEVSLAISLHAPNNALRDQLMPVNRKYPIEMLLASCRNYLAQQSDRNRQVTVEYILIAGVNDQLHHARELAALLRDFPCKINLIPFNTIAGSDYQRPSGNAVSRFWQILVKAGYTVTVRSTRGDDIAAACGQLVGQVADRSRRSERHRRNAATQALRWA